MAAVLARPLELDLLCQKLDAEYGGRIIGTGNSQEARRSNFLSKAIAAFVLHEAAGASLDDSIASSIDGGFDHGIDSVYIAPDHTIWLIQSKYKDAGTGEPELGDVSKFRDGVTDLLANKWERFNAALRDRQAAITNALNGGACRVRVILAHTGTAMSDDRRDIFADLERAFNGAEPDFVRCFAYGLTSLHELHMDGLSAQPIESEIELRDFGHTQQPYRAFYGRMDAKALAQLWADHRDHLVERNIRRFKGSTTVNVGLSETLQQEAEHFFYFNNGVTFLCSSIQQQGQRDPNRQLGKFRVKGLSIINGAQTVGAIAREPIAHYDAHPAEVMATFVCLENAPDDFGDRVTQSRNRQNAVDIEDFAALDERQVGWQRTLHVAGIEYVVRHGEDDPPPSASSFSTREAAPFLACTITGGDWQDFVVAAKTDKKRLFSRQGLVAANDPLREAYSRLFPDSLTARQMWRVVQIGRLVSESTRARANAEADPGGQAANALPAKEILKHGVWLVLHVIFFRLQLQSGEYLDDHANQERTRIAFQSDEEPELEQTLVSRRALNQGIASALRPLLTDDLKSTNEEKRVQIEKFVEQAPEYRALTHPRYREIIEQRIQPGLSDEKLDEALLHVKREVEDGVRKDLRHVAANFENQSFEQYAERFQTLAEQANELGKAELAKYVTHRRTILDLVSLSLKKRRSDDKYPLERVLHKMLFPMGVTSKDIFFEQQNLWVIDERLCYHTLLTSDKKLNSIDGLEDTSGKEPDICAFFYDTPIGVREEEDSTGAIIVIEFKRPGRDDYQADPAQQVIKRFVEIQESKLDDVDGRPINARGIRFFGYLIADLTPSLKREMRMNYHESIDGEGYFKTLTGGNGYVEIISYDKLLKDAARRNRVLFEKLGLHKN